jgi:hypothetical protein
MALKCTYVSDVKASPARERRRRGSCLWLQAEPGEPLHRQLESALRRLIHLGQVPPARACQVSSSWPPIRPIALARRAARLLGVAAGAPAFLVERHTFAEEGPIEWQESMIRGDRYLYSVDLPRRRPERNTATPEGTLRGRRLTLTTPRGDPFGGRCEVDLGTLALRSVRYSRQRA